MAPWILIPILLAGGAARPVARGPRPVVVQRQLAGTDPAITLIATPASISFSASNPDSAGVPANAVTTITWRANGDSRMPWLLTIQADSSSLGSCPRVPVSAVTVTCSQAAVSHGGIGICSPSMTLADSPRVIAAGMEAAANASYQVNLAFTLADSWKYVAQLNPPCSLTLSYTAYVP